jgi:hypothetical protein
VRTRRIIVIVAGAVAAVMLWAAPAFAHDHLADATDAPGAGYRDFGNPVAQNPSGTSGAAARPATVPGGGNPNSGVDVGTPSADLSLVITRSGGHASP